MFIHANDTHAFTPCWIIDQQAPANVKQKSDANRAAAQDTRWSEVVTLPSPDNPV